MCYQNMYATKILGDSEVNKYARTSNQHYFCSLPKLFLSDNKEIIHKP